MIKKLLLIVTLVTVCQFSNAQFALGDIAFSRYNSDTTVPAGTPDDSFTFVVLRDVMIGETITFDENGWFSHLGGFRSGESKCTLTFTSNYPAGTQIIVSKTPFTALDQNGSTAASLTGSGLNLATGGDSIFAYNPGSVPSTSDESGFIAAINMTGQWLMPSGADSSSTTEKPSIFTDGLNSVSIEPEIDNAQLNPTQCNNFTDIASLRVLLNTASNWETNDASGFQHLPTACNFLNTLSIDNIISSVNEVKFIPNPVNNTFNVVTSNDLRLTNLEIFDITGKQVFNVFENTNEKSIDISALGAGIYLVKINFGNTSVVKKLVKN